MIQNFLLAKDYTWYCHIELLHTWQIVAFTISHLEVKEPFYCRHKGDEHIKGNKYLLVGT